MLICRTHGVVIFTPPHTASGQAMLTLANRGLINVFTPNPDGQLDHHGNTIPAGCEGFEVVVVTRNPWERLVGLWWHLTGWQRFNGKAAPSFAEFVERASYGSVSWFYRTAIADRWVSALAAELGGRRRVRLLDVSQWGAFAATFGATWPTRPTEWRLPWREYWTPELVALAPACVTNDAALGYSFNFDTPELYAAEPQETLVGPLWDRVAEPRGARWVTARGPIGVGHVWLLQGTTGEDS